MVGSADPTLAREGPRALQTARNRSAWRPTGPSVGSVSIALLVVLAAACGSDNRPAGLKATPPGAGPEIVWDLYAKPVAEVPFPNDIATVFDERSPTHLRVNLSQEAPTALERGIRRHIDELDGFGTFAPITLRFDAPLDLSTATQANIWLVNVDPASRAYGQAMPLDLGGGSFPVRDDPSHFFPFDPDRNLSGYVFPPDNVADRNGDGTSEWVDFYEVATDTLIVRPLFPLEQRSHYAVVLTDGLRGKNGQPIRSPFASVHHLDQTDDLAAALPVLDRLGVPLAHWAFAWTFTTQSVTSLLETARRGLDGEGPLARIAKDYPPKIDLIENLDITTDGDGSLKLLGIPKDPADNKYILQSEFLSPILSAAENFSPPGTFPNFGVDGVDYFVFGSFLSPSFIKTPDNVMDVNPDTGEGTIKPDRVTFMLSIPRETKDHHPPFPVLIYAHGSNTSRLESVGFANTMSRFGIAVAAIDAVGHGPFDAIADARKDLASEAAGLPIPPQVIVNLLGVLTGIDLGPVTNLQDAVDKLFNVGVIKAIGVTGRAVDVDGDGITDSGAAFFRANAFQTRDTTRQTVIDTMQFIRVLEHLGERSQFDLNGDGVNELDGDFNGDGRIDLGGPGATFAMSGTSLGGILTNITTAVEPKIVAGAPVVPGGGFADLILRSRLRFVTQDIFLQVIGPVVVGCPIDGGQFAITLNNDTAQQAGDEGCDPTVIPKVTLATLPAKPGAVVTVKNRANGEERSGTAESSGGFAVGIPADVGDALDVTLVGSDGVPVTASITSSHEGLGFRRNTPDVRRFIGLAQMVFEAGDPINYAPHLFQDPLPGVQAKPMLQTSDPGDFTVPFNTHIALARAAGYFGDQANALRINDILISHDVMLPTGEIAYDDRWDIDDLDHNNGGIGPLPPIPVPGGVAAVRFPRGIKHEFIGFSTPDAPIDWAVWSQNQIGLFVSSAGKTLTDDLCLQDSSCPFVPPIP